MNRHKFVVHVGRDGTRYENVCGHVIGPDQICRHLPQNQIHLSDDVAGDRFVPFEPASDQVRFVNWKEQ